MLTPRTPGVVTEVDPLAAVELCTVVELNGIREVSVIALVLTTGVGVELGVDVGVGVAWRVAERPGDVFDVGTAVGLADIGAAIGAGVSGSGCAAP